MKEKNKIVTFIGVLGLLFVALFLYAKPSSNENSEFNTKNIPVGSVELENAHTSGVNGILNAKETFYDFGNISMKDGKVSKIFQVSNLTTEDVKVSSIITSCMCTNAYIMRSDGERKGPFGMPGHGAGVTKANEVIKAGETMNVEVVYDPNAHGPAGVGLIERFVYLEDENKNVIEFKIKVNVTP